MFKSLKKYMLSVMKDECGGILSLIIKAFLTVLSWGYRIAIGIVDWSYRTGIRRQYSSGMPTISVGNITLGGTGKTPFTIFLADLLLTKGLKPAVLTRGYGKDECRMLSDELADVPVFVGQDRVRGAKCARRDKRDVLILDDGFQHRRLSRDLDIVLFDSVSMAGNGRLFPRGVLREPVDSIKRADMFVLTKTDMADTEGKEEAVKLLNDTAPGKPVIMARHRPAFLADVTGAASAVEELNGKRICLVSGIADPAYFSFMVENLGGRIVERFDYSDHHNYMQKDVRDILKSCHTSDVENIIVTKKDFVKLRDLDISYIEDKLYVLNIVMDIVDGKEFLVAGLNSIISG